MGSRARRWHLDLELADLRVIVVDEPRDVLVPHEVLQLALVGPALLRLLRRSARPAAFLPSPVLDDVRDGRHPVERAGLAE